MPTTEIRPPENAVALTVDFAGAAPVTSFFNPNELDKICEIVEQKSKLKPADRANAGVHASARRFCAERAANPNPETQQAVAMATLWCALNHPTHSAEFRRQLSSALQKEGRAYITAACDLRGNWAYGVGAKYVNLQNALSRVQNKSDAASANLEGLFGRPN